MGKLKMPSINTYFGDYLLGLWVTWTSEASTSNTGTSDLEISFRANLRAKAYVYTVDATSTATDKATIGGVDGSGVEDNYDTWVAWEGSANNGVTAWFDEESDPAANTDITTFDESY